MDIGATRTCTGEVLTDRSISFNTMTCNNCCHRAADPGPALHFTASYSAQAAYRPPVAAPVPPAGRARPDSVNLFLIFFKDKIDKLIPVGKDGLLQRLPGSVSLE